MCFLSVRLIDENQEAHWFFSLKKKKSNSEGKKPDLNVMLLVGNQALTPKTLSARDYNLKQS